MGLAWFVTIIVGSVILLLLVGVDCYQCNSWYSNRTGSCKCGSDFSGRLQCHDWNQSVDISAGFCITYVAKRQHIRLNETGLVVGDCAYGFVSNMLNRKFSHVPKNVSDINHTQCDPYKRKGLFCGECRDGYGPAAYSFHLQCANCSHMSTGVAIVLYALLEILPVTIFFFIVLIFRFKLMAGPNLGYVLFCQSVINTLQYSRYLYSSLFLNLPQQLIVLGHLSLVLSGVWNLEFFRFIIPPFCISERMTAVHQQMLGFMSVIYPLTLVLMTYLIVELSARCNVMNRCVRIHRFVIAFNVEHSVIHVFATFTMLSMFSTLCQGYAILQTSRVFDMIGTVLESVLYIYPNIVMFSYNHLPYVFASVTLVLILVISPSLVVCIYPTKIYTKLSHHLSARKQLVIKIFVETVNNGFKDGLNNTHDYRMLLPIFILLAFAFSLLMSLLPHYGWNGFPPLTIGTIFAFASFLVAFLRPCKTLLANMSLSFHLLLVGIMSLLGALWWQDLMLKSEVLASAIVITSAIPHVLMMTWVVHCVLEKYNGYSYGLQVSQLLYSKMKKLCNCNIYRRVYQSQLHEVTTDTDEEEQLVYRSDSRDNNELIP